MRVLRTTTFDLADVTDDAPVLQRCEHCHFSDELDEDGYCLLCSQTAKPRKHGRGVA